MRSLIVLCCFISVSMLTHAQSVGGNLAGADTVCQGTNSGFLTLSGHNGSILRWEQSFTGSAPWLTIGNSTSGLSYSNLNQTSFFRAVVQDGSFAESASTSAKITVQDSTVSGYILGPSTVCSGSLTDTIRLSSNLGSIVKWRYSTNQITWFDSATTSNDFPLTGITTTSWYTAVVQNGVCASRESQAFQVSISPTSNGGLVSDSDTVCSDTNSTLLSLSAYVGDVLRWESSQSTSGPWSAIFDTSTSLAVNDLTASRNYRAIVQSGVCPADTSAMAFVQVDSRSRGGQLIGNASVCDGANSGSILHLAGNGAISKWQYSTNGGSTWRDSLRSQSSWNYSNLDSSLHVRVLVSNGVCPELSSDTAIVIVNPLPTVSFSIDSVCLGDSNSAVNVSSVPSGSLSYDWDLGDGSRAILSNPKHLYVNPGSYNITLVARSSAGCSDTARSVAKVHPLPSVDFSAPEVCDGNQMLFTNRTTISQGSLDSMSWDFGDASSLDTSLNPGYSYSTHGSYQAQLFAISDYGCIDSLVKPVLINENPTVDFSFSNVCDGNAITFSNNSSIGTGNLNFNWKFGNGDSSLSINPSYLYSSSGSFGVLLTASSNKQCSGQLLKTAVINPQPIPNFGIVEVCFGDSVKLSDSSSLSSGNYSLTWALGDGNALTGSNVSHSYSVPGVFTVVATALSDSGCSASLSKSLSVHPLPTVNFSSDPVCDLDSSSFQNLSSVSSGSLQHSWEFAGGGLSQQENPTHFFGTADFHQVKLISTTDRGCKDSLISYSLVNPSPNADFLFSNSCDGVPITFQNSSNVTNGAINSFLWDFGDGTNSQQENPIKDYLRHGTYFASLEVSSLEGCIDSTVKKVVVYPGPLADFEISSVCIGEDVFPINTSSITSGGMTYIWQWGDGNSSFNSNPEHLYNSSEVFKVSLTAISDQNCRDSLSKFVAIYANPQILLPSDTNISRGLELEVDVQGATSITWTPAENVVEKTKSQFVLSPLETTSYRVFGTNEYGCQSSVEFNLEIDQDHLLFPSNVVTPNSDGINDFWVVENISAYESEIELRVLNRWGKVVFEDSNYQNDWEGTNTSGDALPDGTYYYIIDFPAVGKLYKGSINLLRN